MQTVVGTKRIGQNLEYQGRQPKTEKCYWPMKGEYYKSILKKVLTI